MIDFEGANQLLNLGFRIGEQRAREQLEGAVAIHNILEKHRVAYLADEVGMGKTYVALATLALFRHFQPDFRVLIIAPRENIQRKWMKEAKLFAANNLRFTDLRNRSIDRQPVRSLVACENLIGLARECLLDPDRDFFMRLPSFSIPLGADSEGWRNLRDRLRECLPWLPDVLFDLRSKETFKQNFACTINCALPVFDLIIIDEGHNLKHGFSPEASARNQALARVFGHPSLKEERKKIPGYGPKATRVLYLSATPLEESYHQIWNQLDIFGLGDCFPELCHKGLDEEERKKCAAHFLVRRVTSVRTGEKELTKNQYRREWRAGGVFQHDEPIEVEDPRHRLIVALVQKKVAELLGSDRFNMSFQIGMLASFESFLETTKLKQKDEEQPVFDDAEQTDDQEERDGIDVRDLNRLARDYRRKFGHEMPHPKMDAVVKSLSDSWRTGRKNLLFVRRVNSVKELKRKLDELYDQWLMDELRRRLVPALIPRLEELYRLYHAEKLEAIDKKDIESPTEGPARSEDERETILDDRGGSDTFFAWFFRGDGPKGVVSGANIQQRFIKHSGAYSLFFERNHVADLLGIQPGQVLQTLALKLGISKEQAARQVNERAVHYLGRVKKQVSLDLFEAAQAAAVELLQKASGELGSQARVVWHERFRDSIRTPHALQVQDVTTRLEQTTFFTELQMPERCALREDIWPDSSLEIFRERFREREIRAQLLATAARLGHAFIDLYILIINRIGSFESRVREAAEDEDIHRNPITEYLELLETQMAAPIAGRNFRAFDELSEIGRNYELIMDVNAPEVRDQDLSTIGRAFGMILRQQQPVGGMYGQVNKTLVQQFRMPGYPLVLVTTDLMQEGEDLHSFCSSMQHYGISWTPSSMEQRIGRIDRVRSQTDRRLSLMIGDPSGPDLLQVYYPYLQDTVEVVQVQRVLERMNVFLRLMHEGLKNIDLGQRTIDLKKELILGRTSPISTHEKLQSAFPVPAWALKGEKRSLAVDEKAATAIVERFRSLASYSFHRLNIEWKDRNGSGIQMGTVRLTSGRIQPFALYLKSVGERPVLRCISPVGKVDIEETMDFIIESVSKSRIRLGAVQSDDESERSYNLTVEDDVILGDPQQDQARLEMLLRRVTSQADLLEQIHLPPLDQPLEKFENDLQKEGHNE